MSSRGATRYRRSPFLVLFWQGDQAVLMNAHTQHRYNVHANLVDFLSRLGNWRTADDLSTTRGPVRSIELAQLREWGIVETEDDATAWGDAPFAWDPIELAIQRGTSFGGLAPDVGSSPPPRHRPRLGDRPITSLPPPAPSLAMPLTEALGRRRSIRSYAPRPLRLHELSTLLHHSARVVAVRDDPQLGERALRPFPTAGARSELELYVVANDVAGVPPGAHYYDPTGHQLLKVRDRDRQHERILHFVKVAAGGQLDRDPAVVLLITAVFERVMWKYRQLGLSLIYKDVGTLMQTLYLVAAALDLAPCAIGGGDEAENSRWLGLDPLRESQVGCFLVGPAPCSEEPST